jgi:hypothetical protein
VRGKGGRPHILKISYDAAQTVDRVSSRILVIGRMVSDQPGLPLRPAQPGCIWSGGVPSTTRRTRFPPKTALQLSLTRQTNVPKVPPEPALRIR